MSKLREAAEQALAALQEHGQEDIAIALLKAALADPAGEPEPVAHVSVAALGWLSSRMSQPGACIHTALRTRPEAVGDVTAPLYRHPPQRKPLADAEITKEADRRYEADTEMHFFNEWFLRGVRYAEQIHGIGGGDE